MVVSGAKCFRPTYELLPKEGLHVPLYVSLRLSWLKSWEGRGCMYMDMCGSLMEDK